MLEMGGGSVGLQIGASAIDVVMLVMERGGMDSLLKESSLWEETLQWLQGRWGRRNCRDRCGDEGQDPQLFSQPRSVCGTGAERHHLEPGWRCQ